MEIVIPDTLVLKIVDTDLKLDVLNASVYILYDTLIKRYIIRGVNYSYECASQPEVVNFLELLLDDTSVFSFILYNYTNLPSTSNEITFHFLNTYACDTIEVTGHENVKLNKRYILKYLRTLKNVFNYY